LFLKLLSRISSAGARAACGVAYNLLQKQGSTVVAGEGRRNLCFDFNFVVDFGLDFVFLILNSQGKRSRLLAAGPGLCQHFGRLNPAVLLLLLLLLLR